VLKFQYQNLSLSFKKVYFDFDDQVSKFGLCKWSDKMVIIYNENCLWFWKFQNLNLLLMNVFRLLNHLENYFGSGKKLITLYKQFPINNSSFKQSPNFLISKTFNY
jgi:hypothetical protein